MKTKNYLPANSTLKIFLKTAVSLALFMWLPASFGVTPYVADANTVLLDHLDGATSGSVLGYYANTGPCGSQRPSTAPNTAFVPGPTGLGQALQLCHIPGLTEETASYLKYNGQVLSLPNGTLEFWIYLTSYGSGLSLIDQGPYYGSCAGWTFGMGVQTNGTVTASAWAAFNVSSGNNVAPLNRWTHLAFTWGSTGAKIYINGQLAGTDSNTGMPAGGFGGNAMFRLGTHSPGVCSMIDELRVSNIQRTSFNVTSYAPLSNMKSYAGFTITADAGAACQVEYAPVFGNTNNWQVLTNFTLPSNPYIFIDYSSSNNGNRFYRAILLP